MTATTNILDFEQLLAPISPDAPAGTDPRADRSSQSLYFRIKAERSAARTAERRLEQGDTTVLPPRVHWRAILELVPQMLATRAKDLEVSAYLTEALIREHGFEGLRAGFQLIRELCERFWEDLYPRPDESGVLGRIAYIDGLNGRDTDGTLIQPIMTCAITGGDDPGPYSTADYHKIQVLQKLDPSAQKRRVDEGHVSMKQFERAVLDSPPGLIHDVRSQVRQCLEEHKRMCGVLDERCGSEVLHSTRIRKALESCLETLNYFAGPELAPPPPEPVKTASPSAEHAPSTETTAPAAQESPMPADPGQVADRSDVTGPIRNREEALQMLSRVAEFFSRYEPHSPLSYAAKQLVRWGDMQLPELLDELIPDRSARDYFSALVGLKPDDGQSHHDD